MSTVITVLDRAGVDSNTDIIVLADAEIERLLWIPRDTWCEPIRDRINVAFKNGGHALLLEMLAFHGFDTAHSLVLSRNATEAALKNVRVEVPVPERLEFDYPLAPTKPIEEGRKKVIFTPPTEVLQGERIHQWIGARRVSDLLRLERQGVFLRCVLASGCRLDSLLENPDWYWASSQSARETLLRVRPTWKFGVYKEVLPQTIDSKMVLVNKRLEVE